MAARGKQPYQDFDLLYRLRNAIVHLNPDRAQYLDDGSRLGRPHKVAASLESRGVLKRSGNAAEETWLGLISSPAVAKWAYDTVFHIAKAIHDALPPHSTFQLMARMSWSSVDPL
jgi:hypothetical protein